MRPSAQKSPKPLTATLKKMAVKICSYILKLFYITIIFHFIQSFFCAYSLFSFETLNTLNINELNTLTINLL